MKYEWLDQYLLSNQSAQKDFKVEWGWDRYLLKNKMFAAICRDKAGRPIITLKCEPMHGAFLREQYSDIVSGYYMNKEHWNSVCLDGEVPEDVLKSMIDESYQLIFQSMSKKMQKDILE